jgi:hypothetical protein
MNISEEAVQAAHAAICEQNFDDCLEWRGRCVKAVEAAAPYMLAEAWAEGHESGFWNGRESAGSGEMELCGVEHAKVANPYRSQA